MFCIPTEEMTDPDSESYETKHEAKHEQPKPQPKNAENPAETPTNYIMRECSNIGMDMQELGRVRAALVEANIVRNIPTKEIFQFTPLREGRPCPRPASPPRQNCRRWHRSGTRF